MLWLISLIRKEDTSLMDQLQSRFFLLNRAITRSETGLKTVLKNIYHLSHVHGSDAYTVTHSIYFVKIQKERSQVQPGGIGFNTC